MGDSRSNSQEGKGKIKFNGIGILSRVQKINVVNIFLGFLFQVRTIRYLGNLGILVKNIMYVIFFHRHLHDHLTKILVSHPLGCFFD